MARLILITGLLLTLIFLVTSIGSTLRNDALPEVAQEQQRRQAPASELKRFRFYPPVPSSLPDLRQGYLFNEARNLETENGSGSMVAEEPAASIQISELIYLGSVISGEEKKALVSYPASAPETPQIRGRRQPRNNTTSEREYAQVAPGEQLGEFTVAAVYPDRLILEKDGRKIEKYLNESGEERLPPPPQVGAAARANLRTPTARGPTPSQARAIAAARRQGTSAPAPQSEVQARQSRQVQRLPVPGPGGDKPRPVVIPGRPISAAEFNQAQ